MSVLQRKELEDSPLADLHAIASELGLEGFRAMRKADLIKAILDAQNGGEDGDATEAGLADTDGDHAEVTEAGVLDILPNGSGFVRRDPAGQSPDDVYVAPAQIRRCELRAGDEVSGPVRPPRRNERHPSLVRVETVNGAPAEPPEERPWFGDLTPVFPTERLAAPAAFDSAPFGKGSRVAVGGPPGAGASTLLLEVVRILADRYPDMNLQVVLAGVRPEEVGAWRDSGQTVVGGSFERSPEAQAQAAELAVERAKRLVERGGHAAGVIDALDALPPGVRRRLFGAARATEEGGTLTIVAATGHDTEALRWASTRIVLEGSGPSGTLGAER